MTVTSAAPRELDAMASGMRPALLELDRHRITAESALAALRRGSDPWRLHLDPGLLAEVHTLVDGWRGIDRLVLDTARAVARDDVLGAILLRLSAVRARAATHAPVTAADLVVELRHAAAGPPDVVASWFDRLSPAEVALLEQHDDGWLAGLDGVPPAVRDRVNRRLVDAELERLRAEVAEHGFLARNVDVPLVADGLRDAHRASLDRIAALEQLLAADLVLLFDPRGDGRAVATYGDPTTARHVTTVVPGISNHLGNLGHTLDSARHLAQSARDRREGDIATIAWLGYDTPGSIGNHSHELVTEATTGARARRAAGSLTRFVDGLTATRAAGAAHLSVIGHSYGSRVLGEALSTGELHLDEAVAVGSPGMGVDHVGEWDLPARTTVWAESGGTPGGTWWLPGGGDDAIAHVPFHGRNPDDPAFGAEGFDVTGATGHSAYFAWDDETGSPSVSLRSLATIVTGGRPGPDTDQLQWAPGPLEESPTWTLA